MRSRTVLALVTLAVAVPALLLTPVLFPVSPDMTPTSAQRPLFMLLGACYALALGLGVTFVAFGWPSVRRLIPASRARAIAAYLTVAWLLISWYPHGGLHMSSGMNTSRLLLIEYGFHLPLVAAPIVLIWAFAGGPGALPANADTR